MSPVLVNGRELGVAQNGVFDSHNTDPIPAGRLWPEAALTWNAMRLAAIADGIPAAEFVPAGPNSSARGRPFQDWAWDQFQHHGGNPAAQPYTSNHGWAIAVDVLGLRARAWIMRNGWRFGWSWDEGRRVGESWHMRYVGATRSQLRACRRRLDPVRALTKEERRAVRAFDRLHRRPWGALSTAQRHRRRALHDELVRRRKGIWSAAQRDGWEKANRRQRYEVLRARTR